jgi:hypothetical protein
MLTHEIFDSDRYCALEPIDRDVLWLLIRKHNGRNNGSISLGLREVVARYRCSMTTASRAFQRLQKAGFITEVHKGHLVPVAGRTNVATTWRLNFVTEGASKDAPRDHNQSARANSGNSRVRATLVKQRTATLVEHQST